MKTLIGKVRKRQVFELPHDIYCTETECFCKEGSVTVTRVSKGNATNKSFLKQKRIFPATLVIGFRETKVIRDQALKCPGVAAAIQKGQLAVR